MQIIFSARNVEVAETVRRRVEEQFGRLSKFESSITRAEVTLLEEKNRCIAEANLSIDREAPVHGRAEAPDFRSAVDRLSDKLSRQLKKRRSRRRDRKQGTDLMMAVEEGDG
jgi:ribosomal subunit interface protein